MKSIALFPLLLSLTTASPTPNSPVAVAEPAAAAPASQSILNTIKAFDDARASSSSSSRNNRNSNTNNLVSLNYILANVTFKDDNHTERYDHFEVDGQILITLGIPTDPTNDEKSQNSLDLVVKVGDDPRLGDRARRGSFWYATNDYLWPYLDGNPKGTERDDRTKSPTAFANVYAPDDRRSWRYHPERENTYLFIASPVALHDDSDPISGYTYTKDGETKVYRAFGTNVSLRLAKNGTVSGWAWAGFTPAEYEQETGPYRASFTGEVVKLGKTWL